MDARRFGVWAAGRYTLEKAIDDYEHMYQVHYPGEFREPGRTQRTTPIYETLKSKGAVFGEVFGWERAKWFDSNNEGEQYSFKRNNSFSAVAEECRAVREKAGLLDLSSFAKFDIEGPDAETFLNRLCANRIPKKTEGISLVHLLTDLGGIECEGTVARLSENQFYFLSAAVAEIHDEDWLVQQCLPGEQVQIKNVTDDYGVLVLTGPKSREILSQITDADLSNEAFPWLRYRQINVSGIPVRALRVSYVGELGWELHHPLEYQNHIFDKLMEHGKDLGLKPFGIRAMNSLRVEKSYKLVGTELSIEYSPYESGLDRFIHPNKGNFIGLEALNKWREKGFDNKLVTLEVHNTKDADVLGNNPIFKDGKVVGRATGGEFGFRLDKSIALAMVKPDCSNVGDKLQVDILGEMYDATVLDESPYDSENNLLRA